MLTRSTRLALIIFLLLIVFGTTVFLMGAQYFLANFTSGLDRAIIRQLLLLLVMFIPAAVAIAVKRLVLHQLVHDLGWRLGPLNLYLRSYGAIALAFVLNYGLTWAFIIPADWTFASFLEAYAPALPLPASLLFVLVPLLTFIIAPIINMIPALGEEIGWRGFFLDLLSPLGKLPAIIISASVWALWHLAIISLLGFGSLLRSWQGIMINFLMLLVFGLWLGWTWFKARSTVLTAFMHATFNASSYAFWFVIFASGSRLLIRSAGLAGFIVMLVFGLLTLYWLIFRRYLFLKR